jgi:hypothetical protein
MGTRGGRLRLGQTAAAAVSLRDARESEYHHHRCVSTAEVTRTVITVGVAEATGAGEDNGIDHNKN